MSPYILQQFDTLMIIKLPPDLQPFLVVCAEELKGFVDLQEVSPVLAHVELWATRRFTRVYFQNKEKH